MNVTRNNLLLFGFVRFWLLEFLFWFLLLLFLFVCFVLLFVCFFMFYPRSNSLCCGKGFSQGQCSGHSAAVKGASITCSLDRSGKCRIRNVSEESQTCLAGSQSEVPGYIRKWLSNYCLSHAHLFISTAVEGGQRLGYK